MVPYWDKAQRFRISYPSDWNLSDKDGIVSLWKGQDTGAITISSAILKDRSLKADALQECTRWVKSNTVFEPVVSGNPQVAVADYNDPNGTWWSVRAIAGGPRIVVATYNTKKRDASEEVEMRAILESIEVVEARPDRSFWTRVRSLFGGSNPRSKA